MIKLNVAQLSAKTQNAGVPSAILSGNPASVGAEVRAVGPEPRRPRLIAFVLWDYGDAPLLHGW